MTKKEEQKILEEVLKKLIPAPEDIEKANKFIDELNKLLNENNVDAEAVLGGSMAKNTFLKEDYDADVFIKFSKKYKGKNISKILETIIEKKFKYERVKGSRDYYHIKKDFLFELVPVIDVKKISEAENVIDMSPLHVKYFKNKGKNLENEVRLLKKFMKANRVYGSESYINGFSGHVVDLLIIKYKSFMNVLKATKKWIEPVIIDIEKKLKDPLMELDRAKISGPMIIVDPVQENRNAAAALGFKCYNSFIEASKKFLEKPSKEFFVFKNAKEIITKKHNLFKLIINPLKGNKDISGAKTLKAIEYIKRILEEHDFEVIEYEWDYGNTCTAYFAIKKNQLKDDKIIRGPPISSNTHCKAFKEKHQNVFEKNNYLYSKQKRKYKKAIDCIKSTLKNKYIKERIESVKLAETLKKE